MAKIKTMEDLERRKLMLKTKSTIVKNELGDSLLEGKTRVEDKLSLVKLLVPAVAIGALAVVLYTSGSDERDDNTKSLINDYQSNIEETVPSLKKPGNPQWLNIVLDMLPFLVNVFKTMMSAPPQATSQMQNQEFEMNQAAHMDNSTIPSNA